MADLTPHQNAANAIDQLLKANPDKSYLIFGENHPQHVQNCQLIGSQPMVDVLIAHGKRSFAIESPEILQDTMDSLMFQEQYKPDDLATEVIQRYKGLLKPDVEKDTYQYYLEGAKAAQAFIQVGGTGILYDNPGVSLAERMKTQINGSQTEYIRAVGEAYERVTKDTPIEEQMQDLQFIKQNEVEPDPSVGGQRYLGMKIAGLLLSDQKMKADLEFFRDTRISIANETAAANHIKNHAPDGAVILAGMAHGAGLHDLDEQLGSALRVTLVENNQELHYLAQSDYTLEKKGLFQMPDAYLNVETGAMVLRDEARKKAQAFETSYQNFKSGNAPDKVADAAIRPENISKVALDMSPQ